MGKKLNKNIFIERSIQKHGNLFDYSKVVYRSTSSKVEIICKKHGSFFQSPYNHMSGQKCPSCSGRPIYTTKTFIENSKKIHGNKYDYSKSKYISSKIKVIIRCPIHGNFEQSPNSHFRGNGCQECYNKKRGDSLRHTTESFIKKSKKVHGNKYDYTKVDYTNTKKKVTIICLEHGEFTQSPSQHLIGQGCLRCSNHPVFDTTSFIEDSIKIHGDKYDYSKVKYVNTKTKVKIICRIHGEFEQTPNNHLRGQGCGVCGIINTGLLQRSNTEQFIKDSIIIHGNQYDYSKVDYVKNNLKVKIICPKHGVFKQTPNGHLNGSGCVECGHEKVSRDIRLPFETFLTRSKRVHGKTYDYDEETYTLYTEKMRIICPVHGEFYQTPHSHISMSTGCRKCGYIKGSEKTKLTQEEFLKRSNDIHGNEYDYSLSKYKNSETKVSIICKKHGVFEQLPIHHMRGQGCQKCGYEITGVKSRLTNEEFIEKSKLIHGDVYDYSLVKYRDSNTDVKIICQSHGIFEQNPHSHKKGTGCPKCNSSHGERFIRELLKKKKITFEEQKKFDWLKMKLHLRCDFYLPKYNTVIEYNGRQHYEVIEHFGGINGFKRTQQRDRIKKMLLTEKKVNLIEVRYDENEVEKYILEKLKPHV